MIEQRFQIGIRFKNIPSFVTKRGETVSKTRKFISELSILEFLFAKSVSPEEERSTAPPLQGEN